MNVPFSRVLSLKALVATFGFRMLRVAARWLDVLPRPRSGRPRRAPGGEGVSRAPTRRAPAAGDARHRREGPLEVARACVEGSRSPIWPGSRGIIGGKCWRRLLRTRGLSTPAGMD